MSIKHVNKHVRTLKIIIKYKLFALNVLYFENISSKRKGDFKAGLGKNLCDLYEVEKKQIERLDCTSA